MEGLVGYASPLQGMTVNVSFRMYSKAANKDLN